MVLSLYKEWLQKARADREFSWNCTKIAAGHLYSCTCLACYVHWVFSYNPVCLEENEFGPFSQKILEEGRKELGLPLPVSGKCVDCGDEDVFGYDNQELLCEVDWMQRQVPG
jgi:hypothetical protein